VPPLIDLSLIDRKLLVSNRRAVEWTRRLLAQEGLFVGVSTGAAAYAAARVAAGLEAGTVVFVSADFGWKYLSSGVYGGDLDALDEVLEGTSFW
jgi:cysteine synthase B